MCALPIKNRVQISLFVQSLHHGILRLDVRSNGLKEQRLTILPPTVIAATSDGQQPLHPRIVMLHDEQNVRLVNEKQIVFHPKNSHTAQASFSVIDASDDSGWWSYPLMHGNCEIRLSLKQSTTVVFCCYFPKSIHPLPRVSFLSCDKVTIPCTDQYIGYPDVQLAFIYQLPYVHNQEIQFVAKYREAEQVVAIPVVLPFVINLGVFIIGWLMGWVAQTAFINGSPLVETLQVTRAAIVVAVLPLYLTLWNSSNVLRTIPTLINIITTAIAVTIGFNIAIAIAWINEITYSLGGQPTNPFTQISTLLIYTYALLTFWVGATTFRFVFRHRDNDLLLISIQRILYRTYEVLSTGLWHYVKNLVVRPTKQRLRSLWWDLVGLREKLWNLVKKLLVNRARQRLRSLWRW